MGNAVKGFLICYLIGVLAGSLPFAIIGGVVGVGLAFWYGLVFGIAPLLAIIMIYAIWQPKIHAAPNRWCLGVPFVAAPIFVLAFGLTYPPSTPADLFSGGVWLLLFLAFFGASVSAMVFRSWLTGADAPPQSP